MTVDKYLGKETKKKEKKLAHNVGHHDDFLTVPLDIRGAVLLTRVSNHMPTKVQDEIVNVFRNFNGCTV